MNDTDVDEDALTITVVNAGDSLFSRHHERWCGCQLHSGGKLLWQRFVYLHDSSYGNGGSDTATVAVTVTNVQDAPDAVNDVATIAEDSGANIVNVEG